MYSNITITLFKVLWSYDDARYYKDYFLLYKKKFLILILILIIKYFLSFLCYKFQQGTFKHFPIKPS